MERERKGGEREVHFAGFEDGDRWTSRKVMGYFWELENNFSVEPTKGSTALPRCHQLSTLKPSQCLMQRQEDKKYG